MEQSEDNMSSGDVKKDDSSSAVKKPKKRSLVERELETNMTARMTSPASVAEGLSTSRYGRARRLKTETELIESQKILLSSIKPPANENTPVKIQSPVYRMHASNSPHKSDTPKKSLVTNVDNQIDNIYQENISLSRFCDDTSTPSPAKKFPKVYMRKDLIQNREEEETIMLIQHLFSPSKSSTKSNTPSVVLGQSAKKYQKQKGQVDNSSVVKTLDFDNKIKEKEDKYSKDLVAKNELFEIEAACPFQVGDLAWARVGTFPFWPCIVTRDPHTELFVKKKLFGRVEHDIIHVTFFGDNGRRSWIVDNMLRKYLGRLEFDSIKEKFTPEDKKKDPKLYAAFFVSEKKQALWNMSVKEAETLFREPKRLRIDLFNEMLWKSRAAKKQPKSDKISSRTNSDVSLSESLYDSLFSDKESKVDDTEVQKSRKKSFDVSEVVTACLDNMAAKTGITKIQRQSHMDRWLQKAKSNTPEKTLAKSTVSKLEKPEKTLTKPSTPAKLIRKSSVNINTNPVSLLSVTHAKPYRFRRKTESQSQSIKLVSQKSSKIPINTERNENKTNVAKPDDINSTGPVLYASNVDKGNNSTQNTSTVISVDNNGDEADNKTTINSRHEPMVQNANESINNSIAMASIEVDQHKSVPNIIQDDKDLNESKIQVNQETSTYQIEDIQSYNEKTDVSESLKNEAIDTSLVDDTTVISSQSKTATVSLLKDPKMSKSCIEDVKETNSTLVPTSKSQGIDIETQPMKLSEEKANIFVPVAGCKLSVVNQQDFSIQVDNDTSDTKSINNRSENMIFCEPANISVLEVPNCLNFASGVTSHHSKTVSNKNVGFDVVSDLKEAQNDVTIEVSVTEKKNDDTLNYLPREGEQESVYKLNPSQLIETEVNTLNFFDKSPCKDIIGKEITPRNASTPKKYRSIKADEKLSNITKNNLDFTLSHLDNIIHNAKEANMSKDNNSDNFAEYVETEVKDDVKLTHNNMAMNCRNDELNESSNSESILQLFTEDHEVTNSDAILDDSTQSASILDKSSIIDSAQPNDVMEKTDVNIRNETKFTTVENSSTCRYVESPTFTQLDSEEILCKVEEQKINSEKCTNKNSKHIVPQEITLKVIKKNEYVECDKMVDKLLEDNNETSEDEPSPEYESLDDEITEDFRKHMMSIENNIKDKKDDEQIVKICNEIAEKAKLSPTKCTQVKEMVNSYNTDKSSRNISKIQENIDLKLPNDNAINKETNDTNSLDENHLKIGNNCTDPIDRLDLNCEKLNKSKTSHITTRKDIDLSDKHTKISINSDFSGNVEETKVLYNKIHTKINGDAALHEIPNQPKIIHITRSSLGSARKTNANPDITSSSKIEQYIKSCEHEPRVVIIRLERDKMGYSTKTSKSKHFDEDKSKNYDKPEIRNENRNELTQKEDNKRGTRTCTENKDDKSRNRITTENKEDQMKYRKCRLSLRRKSRTENNIVQNNLEIIKDKPEKLTPHTLKPEEKNTISIELHKQIVILNEKGDASIPEPIKLNGYHHNSDRKFMDTPDSVADTDFDVDTASLNSEDTEVSLPNSIESVSKRNLRSRSEKSLEHALKSPEFLKYLEVKQDFLMDMHPELNADEVVNYIHKSWQYEKDLKSGPKIIKDIPKQETPSRNKLDKKSEPKKLIKDYFCSNYENTKKSIDVGLQSGAIDNFSEAFVPETQTKTKKRTIKSHALVKQNELYKSSDSIDLTLDTSNGTLLDEEKCDTESLSIKSQESLTLRRSSRSKATKSLDKYIFYLEENSVPKEKIEKEQELMDKISPEENKKEQDLKDKSSLKDRIQKEQDLKDIPTHKDELQKEHDIKNKPSNSETTPKVKIQKVQTFEKSVLKDADQYEQDTADELTLKNKIKTKQHTKDKSEQDIVDDTTSKKKTQRKQETNTEDKPTTKEKIQEEPYLKANKLERIVQNERNMNNHNDIPIPKENIHEVPNLKAYDLEEKLQKELNGSNTISGNINNAKEPTPKDDIQDVRDLKDYKLDEKIQNERDLEDKTLLEKITQIDIESESVNSEDSEIPLRQLRSKDLNEKKREKRAQKITVTKEPIINLETKENKPAKGEEDETTSTLSDNEPLVKQKQKTSDSDSMDDPAFIQYLQLKQDSLMDENPQLTEGAIVQYLYKSWLYDKKAHSAINMNNELEKLATSPSDKVVPVKKVRQKQKVEKLVDHDEVEPKVKPRRRIAQPFYNENYSDIEEELEVFEIFKTKKSSITVVSKAETDKVKSPSTKSSKQDSQKVITQNKQNAENQHLLEVEYADRDYVDETERYFIELTKPKPNVFKGLIRENVCEICEYTGSLVKCKGCRGMFHPDCVKTQAQLNEQVIESPVTLKARRKGRKPIRKSKNDDSESHSDEKSHDMSADTSVEDIVPPELLSLDAEYLETQFEAKMKEILTATADVNYDSYSSDDGITWEDSVPGVCEIVDVKLKRRTPPVDYSDFKCNDCQKHNIPVCFVCRLAVSKTNVEMRQKCHVGHCHKYYHLECLDHWPQTQFISSESSRSNKKKSEFLEALTCPRHVCHTCVSDDPRGCKTRFCADKLAKCVRCPATYHSFNKCLPAGSQVLTASHIICPRHSEQKAGKIPCHVNTGWCFICALGGSLICCEYCPTSFHAECLNIKPPEGNYMCEDCETGRLPLYGEMVWVKLGQYRWWPGIILHPSEIPDNIMAVKHELGDFVVRFFGQYDHYWVNRGRVFPYQEGDSGRISSTKSKINEDFICAMEHAQRAFVILKNAITDTEESMDIASSLRPPHYVKLKSNKPCGALIGKRIFYPALSLTQCECDPADPDPCGPASHCLNRMLLTECGPTCRSGERCNNRAFEKRLYPNLVPYRTPQRGWGLKTLDDIRAGQFVIEYVGELIDEEEFRRRMRRKHEIRDENFYFLTLDKERMIDAGPKGNVARFMNHCCEPNCETQKWTVLGDVRVGLFAIEDIPANSEVTFNYNLECAGIEKKRCLCGAKRCSGYIGAKPKQVESQDKNRKLKRPYNKKKKQESPSTSKIRKRGRPRKPNVLTDLEKDVLIIKTATSISNEIKIEDNGLKKKITSIPTEQRTLGKEETKSLKRKRISISTEEVSICNGQEPFAKKPKCDKSSEVGD